MTKSLFRPENPEAIHDRFERIKARALRKAEEQLLLERSAPARGERRLSLRFRGSRRLAKAS